MDYLTVLNDEVVHTASLGDDERVRGGELVVPISTIINNSAAGGRSHGPTPKPVRAPLRDG